jgi:hypothetical protein
MVLTSPKLPPPRPPGNGDDVVTITYVNAMEYDLSLPVRDGATMGLILHGIDGKAKLKGFSRPNPPVGWEVDDVVVAVDNVKVTGLPYMQVILFLQMHAGRARRVLRMRRFKPLLGMPQSLPTGGKSNGGVAITIVDSSEEEDTVPTQRDTDTSEPQVKALVAKEILPSINTLPGNEYELSLPVTSQGIGLRVRKINNLPCFSNLLRPLNLAGHKEPLRGDQIIAIDAVSILGWEYSRVMKCLQNHDGRLMRVLRLKRSLPKAQEDSPEMDCESSGTTPVLSPDEKGSQQESETTPVLSPDEKGSQQESENLDVPAPTVEELGNVTTGVTTGDPVLSPDAKESPQETENLDVPAPTVEELPNATTEVSSGDEFDFRVQVISNKLGIIIQERVPDRGAVFLASDRDADPLNAVQPVAGDLLVAIDKKRVEQMGYSDIVSLMIDHDGRPYRELRLLRSASLP